MVEEKVSIWSISDRIRHYYFPIFVPAITILGLVLVWTQEGLPNKWLCGMETISKVGVFSVIFIFLIHEGVSFVTLTTEYFRKIQRQKGREEGREKGREETNDQWLEWLKEQGIQEKPSFLIKDGEK